MSTEIRYRGGKQRVKSLQAVSCSGECTGGGPMYWVFTLPNGERQPVAESRMLPGYNEKAKRLYAKPWRDRLRKMDKIILDTLGDHDTYEFGMPNDGVRVWQINYLSDFNVVECTSRCVLHVTNNGSKVKRGDFKTAIRKLFPKKEIVVRFPTVREVTIP